MKKDKLFRDFVCLAINVGLLFKFDENKINLINYRKHSGQGEATLARPLSSICWSENVM